MLQYNNKALYVLHYRYYCPWNSHSICWNNEQIYRNNGQKDWEQKNRIISTFISIIGSSLGPDNRSSTVVARCSLCTPIKVLQLLCIVTSYRHPNKNLRPSFSDLHTSLSDHTLSLGMKESQVEAEESDQPLLHPQAHNIGAPLEAGKELYDDLQNIYINE